MKGWHEALDKEERIPGAIKGQRRGKEYPKTKGHQKRTAPDGGGKNKKSNANGCKGGVIR